MQINMLTMAGILQPLIKLISLEKTQTKKKTQHITVKPANLKFMFSRISSKLKAFYFYLKHSTLQISQFTTFSAFEDEKSLLLMKHMGHYA